jgi:hypothetical protein
VAIVGDAYVNIHADTSRVRDQIRDSLSKVNKDFEDAGKGAGDSFNKGFSKSRGAGGGGGAGGQIFSRKFEGELDRVRLKLSNMIAISNALGPALFGVVGAVASLGSGLFALGAAAGQAGPALIVLPALFTAAAQAAFTLKLAFSGVGAAISAGISSGGGGGGAKKAKRDLEQLKNALNGVTEARKKLTEIIRSNAVRRVQAMEAARDAQESVADAVISASGTERTYQRAVLATKDAQDSLSKARKEAIEDLQRLRFEVEGGAISEKKARIQLEKSREALRRVQDMPVNSRARREAEVAFAEADLNLRKAIDNNGDLQAKEKEASKAGVEGSEKVIAAQKDVVDAKYAEESALRDVISAQKDVVRARVEAARAAREVGLIEQESAQRQKDAVDDLRDALKDVSEARKKAFAPTAGGGGGGSDPFAAAMAKLSKEARQFVYYMISIQDEFKKLKAAAGEELFPKLTVAMENLVQNLFPVLIPLLSGTGSALGDVAIRLSQTVTEAANLDRLKSVWKTGDYLIRLFGEGASNLYTSFLILLQAAEPLIKRFADWAYSVTAAWEASAILGEKTGSLTAIFNRAGDVASQLGKIFSNVFGGLSAMFKSSVGPGSGGQFLLDFFQQATAKFKSFNTIGNQSGSLKQYFLDSSVNASLVLTFLNKIFKAIMSTASAPEIGQFASLLTEVVGIWEIIGKNFTSSLPLLGTLAVKISEVLEKFSDTEGLELFFYTLNKVADVLLSILSIPFVEKILPMVTAFMSIAVAVRISTTAMLFFSKAVLGNLILIPKMVLQYTGLGTRLKVLASQFTAVGANATLAGVFGSRAMIALKMAIISTGIGAIIIGLTTLVMGFAMAQMNAKAASDALTDSLDDQTGAFTDETIKLVTDALLEDVTALEEWLAIDKYVMMSREEMAEAVLSGADAQETLNEKIAAGREELQRSYDQNEITNRQYNEAVAALSGLSSSIGNQIELVGDMNDQKEINLVNTRRQTEVDNLAKGATVQYSDAIERQVRHLKESATAQKVLEEQTNSVKDAMNEFKSVLNISQAKDDLANATKSIRKNIKNINMDLSTSKGMQNFRDEFRTASDQVISDALAIGGTPAEIEKNITSGMKKVKTAFVQEAPDKAAARAAVKDFTDELGLIPSKISKTIKDASDAGKQKALDDMKPTGEAAAEGIIAGVKSKTKELDAAGVAAYDSFESGFKRAGKIESPSKAMAVMGGYLVDGISQGIDKNAEKAIKKFTDIVDKMTKGGNDKLKKWGEQSKNRFQEFVEDVKMVGSAVNDMRMAFDSAMTPPKDFTLSTPLKRAEEAAASANTELEKLRKKLGKDGVLKDKESINAGFMAIAAGIKENLVAALQEAQAEYDAIKQKFTDFKSSVVSALTGSIDLSAAIATAKEGGGSITDAINAQAVKAREFAGVVNRLIEAGFSPSSLQSVVSRGVGAGTEIGESLLAGGAEAVAADNSINDEMIAIGEKLAELARPTFLKAGEDTAKAQVDGIKTLMDDQTLPKSPLMKTMTALAKKLGRDVKINLTLNRSQFDVLINVTRKINEVVSPQKSVSTPSKRVTVPRPTINAGATGGIVTRPTFALIGEAGPEAVIPLNKTPGSSPLPNNIGGIGGGNTTINVYPSPGMDEVELASLVSREISFMMRKGSI